MTELPSGVLGHTYTVMITPYFFFFGGGGELGIFLGGDGSF